MIKSLIPMAALLLLLTACGGSPEVQDEAPTDLAGKEALLKTKKAQLQELTAEIAQLEKEIATLDPNRAKEARLVSTAAVTRRDFQHFIEVQGAVEAVDLVDVTPEIGGRIIRLTVQEGDNVRKGQLIAELDLEQIEKQIAELETSLELARTVFERQSRLWEKNIGSEIQYLEAKNNKERIEKSLETIRSQLKRSKVYAPISGVVERRVLQSGELASPGAPIVQILNTGNLKVVADVPETLLGSVKTGEPVTLNFPAINLEMKERVSLIGRTIDPANRTFAVETRLSKNQGMLKPNLMATMLINDFTEPNAIVVPLDVILQEVSGQKFVFVVENGKARKIQVETGRSYKGETLITSGLQGGEELVVVGARGLSESEPVKVVNNTKTEANNG